MPFTPLQLDVLMVLLTAWPVVRILGRLGLPRWPAALLLLSVVIPLLGHMLVAVYAAYARWPNFPQLPKPEPRVKL